MNPRVWRPLLTHASISGFLGSAVITLANHYGSTPVSHPFWAFLIGAAAWISVTVLLSFRRYRRQAKAATT